MAKKETALVKQETKLAEPRVEEPWEAKLRERAKDTKAAFTAGISRVTHKGSIIKIDGKKLEANEIDVVPLGIVWVKEYYEHEYTEGSTDTPACYAFGSPDDAKEKRLTPFPQVPNKQAESCSQCQWDKFMTARKGRGKACGDRPRMLFLLRTDLERHLNGKEVNQETLDKAIAKAPHFQITIPSASIRNMGTFLGSLPDLTPHGDLQEAIVKIGTAPREQGGHELTFEFLDVVPRPAMPALMKRGDATFGLIAQPFPILAEKEEVKPVKGQGNIKKGR